MKERTINIDISKEVFNPTYLPFLDDQTRTQIFFGGSAAGKSVFLAQRAILDLLDCERNYLIVRNVGVTLRTSVFNELKKVIHDWQLSPLFKINKSEMTITCVTGYQALLKGLDDVEKIKSIIPTKGVITDIWIEEATEVTEDDVKQLLRRLRGESAFAKRIMFSFNPIMKTHWIFQKYFSGKFFDEDKLYKDDELLILKTTYKDNKFLEQEDIDVLEQESDKYWYDVYTLGNWGVLGEVIFKNWKAENIDSKFKRTFDNYRNGLDFGFGEPAAFNRTHYDRMRKKIYIVDEVHEVGMTNPVLAEAIRPYAGNEEVVCDSAEPKSIYELKGNGIKAVGAVKGPDSVVFGIQWLCQNEIIIDRKCQNTINEFQVYQWKKNRQGETMRQPVDRNNHHIDAIRYALEGDMPLKKGKRFGTWGRR